MLIKASRITNLTDARYFAAREVDFLGFNLEEGTEGYLDPVYMKAIREWVTGPKIVGEFDRTPAATVREAAAFFGLDAVQVTRAGDLAALEGLDVILAVDMEAGWSGIEQLFASNKHFVNCFLLDFTGVPAAESVLLNPSADWKNLFAQYPTLLHLDLPASTISAIVEPLAPAGLAFRGGEEEKVGVKSFDEIEAVFEALGIA